MVTAEDPDALRAEGDRLLRGELVLRSRADTLARRGLEYHARAREIGKARVVVPMKRRGNINILDVPPGDAGAVDAAQRSADPDAVAEAAAADAMKTARKAHGGPGAAVRHKDGEGTRAAVEAAYIVARAEWVAEHEREPRRGDEREIVKRTVRRLRREGYEAREGVPISDATVRRYKPRKSTLRK